MQGIHGSPVIYPHKKPVTRKIFPNDDVIMYGKTSGGGLWWFNFVTLNTRFEQIADWPVEWDASSLMWRHPFDSYFATFRIHMTILPQSVIHSYITHGIVVNILCFALSTAVSNGVVCINVCITVDQQCNPIGYNESWIWTTTQTLSTKWDTSILQMVSELNCHR